MADREENMLIKSEAGPLVPVRIEEVCAALAMVLISCITFANVLVRYFTSISFAFTEEFSVFLMVFLTFTGASVAFARDRHIRMTFITDRLPYGIARKAEYLVIVLSAAMFSVLFWFGSRLFWDDWKFDTTSPGIGIPQWIYTIWLPILSLVIVLRILGRLKRYYDEGKERNEQ